MDSLSREVHELDPGHPAWPERLGHLTHPPERLWAIGRLELLAGGGVAVVGSRRGSGYGRRIARELGGRLATSGLPVLSGLALGVDGAAHEGAIERGAAARCVAVLGSGPDLASPRAHARLHRIVATEGLVLSEYPPGTTARPHHFPARNRILAALADEVVVVQAAARSGALITARIALELGREVHAVPGPIDHPASEGSNRLLADGATPIVSVPEWVESRGQFDLRLAGSPPVATGWPSDARDLAPLFDRPRSPAELARAAGCDVGELLGRLVRLELAGVVERMDDARYRRTG